MLNQFTRPNLFARESNNLLTAAHFTMLNVISEPS